MLWESRGVLINIFRVTLRPMTDFETWWDVENGDLYFKCFNIPTEKVVPLFSYINPMKSSLVNGYRNVQGLAVL